MIINKTYFRKNIRSLNYSFNESPFGEVIVAWNADGVCYVGYVTRGEDKAQEELQQTFPMAKLTQSTEHRNIMDCGNLTLNLVGTPFEILVWTALLEVPVGSRISYSALAKLIHQPKAVRAVASAVAKNPIGYLVPCHRIVRNDGSIGQYHWGGELKRAILEYEKVSRAKV